MRFMIMTNYSHNYNYVKSLIQVKALICSCKHDPTLHSPSTFPSPTQTNLTLARVGFLTFMFFCMENNQLIHFSCDGIVNAVCFNYWYPWFPFSISISSSLFWAHACKRHLFRIISVLLRAKEKNVFFNANLIAFL